MVIFLALVLILGGGSYAAEQSRPGDLLFPAKISVLENIRSAFAFSGEDRAFWTAEKVNRRFQEVEHLIVDRKFTAVVWEEIKPIINNQISDVNKWTQDFRDRRRYAAASDTTFNLETVLSFHQNFLPILKNYMTPEDFDSVNEFIKIALEPVLISHTEVSRLFSEETIGFDAQAAANEKLASTQAEISDLEKRVRRSLKKISPTILQNIGEQTQTAKVELELAKEHIVKENYNETFFAAQRSFRFAHEANTLLSISKFFNYN